MVSWNSSLSVGNDSLDLQHQLFLVKMKELEAAIDQHTPADVVADLIQFFTSYIQLHFVEEEAFMAEYQYPELGHHQDEHDKFIRQVVEFIESIRANLDQQLIMQQAVSFMHEWLHHHIQSEDLKYAEHARNSLK